MRREDPPAPASTWCGIWPRTWSRRSCRRTRKRRCSGRNYFLRDFLIHALSQVHKLGVVGSLLLLRCGAAGCRRTKKCCRLPMLCRSHFEMFVISSAHLQVCDFFLRFSASSGRPICVPTLLSHSGVIQMVLKTEGKVPVLCRCCSHIVLCRTCPANSMEANVSDVHSVHVGEADHPRPGFLFFFLRRWVAHILSTDSTVLCAFPIRRKESLHYSELIAQVLLLPFSEKCWHSIRTAHPANQLFAHNRNVVVCW